MSGKTVITNRAGVTAPPTAAIKRSNTAPTSRTLAYATGALQTNARQALQPPPPVRSATSPSHRPTATATNLNRSKSESHRMPASSQKLTEKASPPLFAPGLTAKNLILSSTTDEAYIDSGLTASSGHVVRVVESGGICLKPALRALYGRHLPPEVRIQWNRSTEQDHRMHVLLDWIERTRWGIASLGLHKFLLTRSKGALVFNVHGRLPESPEAPAVDWITFEDAQRTLEPQIQRYIGEYDPETHALVFAFRMSPSEDTLKIWGKSIGKLVPENLMCRDCAELYSRCTPTTSCYVCCRNQRNPERIKEEEVQRNFKR
ncbi:hypothetical protein FRC02_003120 [Tulasnella sp. 418]|nr:hypothetical protein FRC02_003120 [Tulasnella sp. 418]